MALYNINGDEFDTFDEALAAIRAIRDSAREQVADAKAEEAARAAAEAAAAAAAPAGEPSEI